MFQTVFATASDKYMAWQALNLVGSIKANSDIFDQIFVYDLGMTPRQLGRFADIEGVSVKKVAQFVPHWSACWSWKPWVWTEVPGKTVIYLDAGSEVLQSLAPVVKEIEENGYFVVSQYETLPGGHTLVDIIPTDYYNMLGFDRALAIKPVVAGGLVGFRHGTPFYEKVVLQTLELVKQGLNLGWSESELWRNRAPHFMPSTPVRDCRFFRHDQTLFNMLLYKFDDSPVVAPFEDFGSMEKSDGRQIIWNSKRHSPLAYVSHIPYSRRSYNRNIANTAGGWLIKLATLYHIGVLKRRLKKLGR